MDCLHRLLLLIGFIVLSACGGGGGGSNTVQPPVVNTPPTANAGANQTVNESTLVQLEGAGSDAEGGVSFAWSQVSGPAVALSDSTVSNPSFRAPVVDIGTSAEIQLMLEVTDSGGLSTSDTVTIDANSNDFFVFIADPDQIGARELFAYNPESATLSKLSQTLEPGDEIRTFVIAPDRRHVGYRIDHANDEGSVYVVSPDGSGRQLITRGLGVSYGWAPDGSRLHFRQRNAFTRVWELFTSFPDGSGQVKVSLATTGFGVSSSRGVRPVWAPDSSRILYAEDREGIRGLYTVRPDGTDNIRINSPLTSVNDFVGSSAWAPDGSRIAYAMSIAGGSTEVFTALPDASSEPVRVSRIDENNETFGFLLWLFDSSRITFSAFSTLTEEQRYYVNEPDGGSLTLAASSPSGILRSVQFSPSVSFDSNHIGFLANSNGPVELFSVAADGTDLNRVNGELVTGGRVSEDIESLWRWSPDSSRLSYWADQDIQGRLELYTSQIDGSGNVKVNQALTGTEELFESCWSPDSSRITYRTHVGDFSPSPSPRIFSALPDGSDTHELPLPTGASSFVDLLPWSSDSAYFLFQTAGQNPTSSNLYSASPDGRQVALLNDTQADSIADTFWSPDGSQVIYSLTNSSGTDSYIATADGSSIVNIGDGLVDIGQFRTLRWARSIGPTPFESCIFDQFSP
ncbi:hypothetical protein KFE80_07570 [bacterium SCSIO 12696]|nr:hypothetical protein KFE80_07570 [bacterium SCSIO 12696]